MAFTVSRMRMGLFAVLTASALGGGTAAVWALPSAATAAADPCAASEIARTIGSVSTNTGNYLDSHPATNAALTSAAQQQPPQALATLKSYFDANPQAGRDMATLQQPLTSLSTQCKLPISIPQALQMIQGMAQSGQLPGGLGLPGGTQSPSAGTSAGTSLPGGTSPLPAGQGPLPGPSATTLH